MAQDLLSGIPDATPAAVLAARTEAGLTQARCAELAGLGNVMRWSEYERGVRVIEPTRWALFLLATNQHPRAKAIPIRPPRLPQIPADPGPADSRAEAA